MTAHMTQAQLAAHHAIEAAPIAVAHGDGIGPEIMAATLKVLKAAGARLAITEIGLGEKLYKAGHSAGMAPETWDVIARSKAILKAPITTPQGGGVKSLNVTLRKTLGLFANVRPVTAFAPFVATKHPGMDVVIVRENEEDLYAGIEHRQTDDVFQCLKIVSKQGCEKIIRYAFDYARANGRKKVTCFSKDNIMKLTDGLFHQTFDAIGAEYPGIEKDHMIIDIGAAKLAADPNRFDVIVTLNLYGDIISDIAAEIAGSVGLAPSANIGAGGAMFEAIHGSAPDIAGQGIANPSGLLLAGVMMLVHLGQAEAAEAIHNAWLKTIEDGVHTADIFKDGMSAEKAGTDQFADAVIARLGQKPVTLAPVAYQAGAAFTLPKPSPRVPAVKELTGIDVFVHAADIDPAVLAGQLQQAEKGVFQLSLITNRGVKVWPAGHQDTFHTDHWRCRFKAQPGVALNPALIAELLMRLAKLGVAFVKTEQLYLFDGTPGFSLGQGE